MATMEAHRAALETVKRRIWPEQSDPFTESLRDALVERAADVSHETGNPDTFWELVEAGVREFQRDEKQAAVAAEREACAEIADDEVHEQIGKRGDGCPRCDALWRQDRQDAAGDIAKAIRARGEPGR